MANSTLHQPLLQAMGSFGTSSVARKQLLFHGCREQSPYTSHASRKLQGTRKWLSHSAEYAVSYAYVDPEHRQLGDRLLWVCEVNQPVPALIGSQAALAKVSPWGSSFPWAFPDNFGIYAEALLNHVGPHALLDHHDGTKFKEILMTSPEDAIKVVDVIILPDTKDAAEALARQLFNC